MNEGATPPRLVGGVMKEAVGRAEEVATARNGDTLAGVEELTFGEVKRGMAVGEVTRGIMDGEEDLGRDDVDDIDEEEPEDDERRGINVRAATTGFGSGTGGSGGKGMTSSSRGRPKLNESSSSSSSPKSRAGSIGGGDVRLVGETWICFLSSSLISS
jgi:hypothetical protein